MITEFRFWAVGSCTEFWTGFPFARRCDLMDAPTRFYGRFQFPSVGGAQFRYATASIKRHSSFFSFYCRSIAATTILISRAANTHKKRTVRSIKRHTFFFLSRGQSKKEKRKRKRKGTNADRSEIVFRIRGVSSAPFPTCVANRWRRSAWGDSELGNYYFPMKNTLKIPQHLLEQQPKGFCFLNKQTNKIPIPPEVFPTFRTKTSWLLDLKKKRAFVSVDVGFEWFPTRFRVKSFLLHRHRFFFREGRPVPQWPRFPERNSPHKRQLSPTKKKYKRKRAAQQKKK